MKKIILGVVTLVVILSMTGCGATSFYEGQLKASYEPVKMSNASEGKNALIKVADGFTIWKADQETLLNNFQLNFRWGKRVDSILVKEGIHSLWTRLFLSSFGYRNQSPAFFDVNYKANHEYFIDYVIAENKVFYWIKDLTSNTVVYGHEKTKKDFKKK